MSGNTIEAKERLQWKAWGFSTVPVYRGGDYDGQEAEIDWIARQMDGCPLMVKNGWAEHIAKAASKLLGRDIECVTIASGDRKEIVFSTHDRLTMPERFALEILTRYFDDYYPGLASAGGKVAVPNSVGGLTAPLELTSEEDAHEVAGVLEEVFKLDSEVTSTDKGFAVVLDDPIGDMESFNGIRLHGVCEVLAAYSVRRKAKDCGFICDEDWLANVAGRVVQQKRIEGALADIAARLDAMGTGKAKVPIMVAMAGKVGDKKRAAKSA